jgi:NarL family two-component system response regulator LiaR
MPRIRVLIAEDETMMRLLLERRISNEPDCEVVGTAENGREAMDLALKLRPDVVVMDLNMPVLNGAQAAERIRSQHPHIRIVLLTALDELASIGRAVGATECLNKRCTPEQLVSSIRRAYEAGTHAAAEEPSAGQHADAIARLSLRYGLTERESAVVQKVVTTEHTIQQIASVLSKELSESVTVPAVKHALDRAMNKLGVEPRTRAALVKRVLEAERSAPRPGGPA